MSNPFADSSDEEDTPPVKEISTEESHIFCPKRMKEALNKTLKGVVKVSSSSMSLETVKTCQAIAAEEVVQVMRQKKDAAATSWEAKLLIAHSFSMKDSDAAAKKILTKKLLNAKEGAPAMTILCETWRKEAMDVIATLTKQEQKETIAFDYLIAVAMLITNCTTIDNSAKLEMLRGKRGVDWEKGLSEMSLVLQQAIPKQRNTLFLACNAARNRLRLLQEVDNGEKNGGADKSTATVEKKAVASEATNSPSVKQSSSPAVGSTDAEKMKASAAQVRRNILNSKLHARCKPPNPQAAAAAGLPPQGQAMSPAFGGVGNPTGGGPPPAWARQGVDAPIWKDQAAKWSNDDTKKNPWFEKKDTEEQPVRAPMVSTDIDPSTRKPRSGWAALGNLPGPSAVAGNAEHSAVNVGVRNDNRMNVGVHNNQPPPADAKRKRDNSVYPGSSQQQGHVMKQARYSSSPMEGGEIEQHQPPEAAGGSFDPRGAPPQNGGMPPLHFSNDRQQMHRPSNGRDMHRPDPRRGVHEQSREPPRGRGRGRDVNKPAWLTQGKYSQQQPTGGHAPPPANHVPPPAAVVRPVVDLTLGGVGRGRGRGMTIPAWKMKQLQQEQQQQQQHP